MNDINSPLKYWFVTGEFGNSPKFYAKYGQKGHNGIDLSAPIGTPVYAADDGVVKYEGWGSGFSWMGKPAGICTVLEHDWGYTGYAHLSRTVIDNRQVVKRGQLIGYSGATGAVTGAHLHFETMPKPPAFGNGFAGRVDPESIATIRDFGWTEPAKPALSPVEQVAAEVWAGKWGNGADRKARLEAAGYNYAQVQAAVNAHNKPEHTHVVKRGESLSTIAAKYGITWQELYNKNRAAVGSNPNRIFAGLKLTF